MKKLKKKLEDEIQKMKNSSSDSETSSKERELTSVESSLSSIKVPTNVEEFKQRMRELMNDFAILQQPTDEVKSAKDTKKQLELVTNQIEEESKGRKRLENDIKLLKENMLKLFQQDPNDISPTESLHTGETEESETDDENEPDLLATIRKTELGRKTRYEMEMELILLKKKIS